MHAGYLKTKCGSCSLMESDARDALGCNPLVSANAPAWQLVEEKVTSFMNCPRMFIPVTVLNFQDAYMGYQKKRFALPLSGQQPKKYLDMCDIYEPAYTHFQVLQAEVERRNREMNKTAGMRF